MPGPSRYNRKLKRKNDRRSARASRGGRTRSEAGLARSTAASGRRVSRTNRAAGRPIRSLPKSGRSPVRIDRAKRRKPSYGSMTLSELSAQRKVPRKYRTAAKSASTRSLSPAKQRASRVVGEDGRDLTAIQKIGQAAEIASLAPVGGGVGLATRGLILGAGRVAPRAVRVGKVASKAAKNPGRAGTRAKQAVKKAPGKAKRKVKAKGKKAKRQVKQLKTKKGAARAAKGAAKAPVRVARKNPALATGAYAVAADKTGTNNPVIKTAAADVRGVLDAVDSTSDALETGKTTLRAAPGILTGIGQALGAGGITAGRAALTQASEATGGAVGKKYTAEEIASPVVDTTAEAVRGTKEIVKPFVEGDEAGVKKVVQEQVGFLPIVASPRVISGIRNSKTVNRARQAARENTPRYGSKARQRRSEEQRAENERRKQRDEPKKDKFPTRLGDSRYGGEYLIPVVGRRLERSRERGQTSKDAARGKAVADRQTATVIQSVVPFVRKVKTPAKGKSGNFRRQILDALPTVTAYGIAKDYDTAVEQMARIERGLDRPENPPKASDRRNFAFLRDNPQLFTDENFVVARDRLFDAQDSIVTSEVNRYLPIGASFGIKTPDERLADGVEVQVSVRGGPSQTITVQRDKGRFEPSDIDRKTAKLNNLRNDARAAEKAGDMEKAGQIAAQADTLATDLRAWNLAARKAANEFVEETKALVRERGFETPAYVKDTSNDPEIDQGIDFPASGQLSQRVWVNRDRLRRSGAAERSWDDFVRKSIYGPRAQRVYHSLVTEFVTTRAIPLPSARGTSTYLTRAEINRALSEGLINRKDHAVFHSQHFRAAVQDPYKIDPEKGIGSFYGLDKDGRAQFKELDEEISGSRVAGEIRKRADDPGNKYVVVPRQAVKELEYQFSGPGKLVSRLSNVNRFGSRIVLGYNPSWAVAQLLAEGIPGGVAIGANPLRWRRMRQATKERRAVVREGRKQGGPSTAKRGDPVLARVTDENLRGVISSDQWNLTRVEEKQDYLGKTRYRYKIDPKPAAYVQNGPRGESYDSRIAGVQRGKVALLRGSGYSKENPMKASEGYLYRGVSALEMEQIRKTGVIRSRGDMNIVDSQRGTTSFATDPRTATSYAGGFAPLRNQPTFDNPSFVLRIRDEGFPRANINLPDNEVSLTGPVPASAIVEIVEVRPFRVGKGEIDVVSASYRGRPEGDGFAVGGAAWPQQSFAYKLIRPAEALASPAGKARISAADADLFDGTAGQTAGTTVLPRQNQGVDTKGIELDTTNPVTSGGRVGQFFLDVAKGNALGKFDRWKGGGIRKAVLAAQLDREVNGFLGGLGRYLKLDDQMRTKLKGMSPAQQQTYLLRNPKTARAMESYLDDVMGNWRAITSLEAGPASVTAFYPFVRYSIKSAFWGFPKRHPIKSSILYFFAQLNANELEGLVGEGTPLDWLNYAFPVITVDGDKKVFPDATRIAPALSIVVEAVGTDNFSRIFGGLSPLLGAGYRGLSGDDFTGEPVATSNLDRALLGLAALTSMVAPYRVGSEMLNPDGSTKGLNKLTLRGYTPRREYGEGGRTSVIGGRSETSKALGDLDTDRGLGALLFPFQAQDAKDFAKTREIIAALNEGRFGDLPGSAASGGGSSSSKDLSFREAMLGGSSSSSSTKRKQSFREAMLGP